MASQTENKLLNPIAGSFAAQARDFGIDLTLVVENLKLTIADRLKSNDQAINDLIKFQNAVIASKQSVRRG